MLVPEGEAAWDPLDSELGVLSTLSPPSLGATRTTFFDIAGNKAVGRFQTTANVIEFTLRKLDRTTTPHSAISGLSNAATAKPTGLLPRAVVLKVSEHLLKDA